MASNTTGIDPNPNMNQQTQDDPFASQREAGNDPFQNDLSNISGSDAMAADGGSPTRDRRMSKEWDASKVPPSRFQKREGSIFATQAGRDGHVHDKSRDKAYFEKLKEKGWLGTGSSSAKK